MTRSIIVLSVLLLSGCASARQLQPLPSTLQRYDALGPRLHGVTAFSARLVTDSKHLGLAIDRDRTGVARAAAVQLKRDALRQEDQTGQAGWRVRDLIPVERDSHPRQYLDIIAAALSAEWWEAAALTAVAGLLWADPLLLSARDVTTLNRLDGRATHAARQAVLLTARARLWRTKYGRYFGYIEVNPATRTGI